MAPTHDNTIGGRKKSRAWLWLLLLVPLALGLARLRFDVEILNLLPDELPVVQGLKAYQRNFADARELILTLEAPTEEETESGARLVAQTLRAETNLIASVTWQPAWVESPLRSTEWIAALWLNQPPEVFGELTNRLAPANAARLLAETRERMASSLSPNEIGMRGYDPFDLMQLPESAAGSAPSQGQGDDLFATREGTFRLLFVEAKPDIRSYRPCRAWLASVRGVIARLKASGDLPAGVQVHYTGRPAFVTEIAGGMEDDMLGSSGGTLLTIGILFWLTHRRLRPLCWLLFLLLVILAGTTALGGLFLGTINVVSMGFAAILAGLAEDFGIVIYQESRSHPELDARALRREVAPGIFWSALTTAGAFLVLNLSALPGLGQLGSLVAIGVAVAAFAMLYFYLPPLLRWRRARDLQPAAPEGEEKFLLFATRWLLPTPVVWGISALLLLASVGVLWRSGPRFDHSPNVLKPKNSDANATLERIKSRFGRTEEPLWVLVPGRNEAEVSRRLAQVEPVLSRAVSNQQIASFTLPTALWPQPTNQLANRAAVAALASRREALRSATVGAGFSTNAWVVTETLLDLWQGAAASPGVFWPTNQSSQWLLRKVVARPEQGFLALGFIHPTRQVASKKLADEWPSELARQGILLSGWELLGTTVFDLVVREMPRVIIPIFLLVLLSLWLAFRSAREVALSLITLAFTALLLWATMGLLGWDWNLLNLMALPLMLGMGVDFSIHMQLALRRYNGDRLTVRRSTGRALLLAGGTTVAGFASLAFSTNGGLASLGKVCALGILLALLVAVYLVPVWWGKE